MAKRKHDFDLEALEQELADNGVRCEGLVYRDGIGELSTRHGIIRSDGTDDIPEDAPIRAVVTTAKETIRARSDLGPASPPARGAARPRRTKRS